MSLFDCFSQIQDPRRAQGRRISLVQLLSISVLAYLAGYRGYRGIARFGKTHAHSLQQCLSLRHKVPSHVTFREVLMNLEQEALIKSFHLWTSEIRLHQEEWLSGDGKALRSTVKDHWGENQDFEAVVSLFAQKSGLSTRFANYRNKSKEAGEIEMLRYLVSELKDMGVVICADALHCQKKP